ncbi:MAG: DNA primase, partial [Clostridia bacterium]|nr:DNA primase [Clostridia bacterium]
MIDRQVIDEILARTDMQGLVGGYVALKRSGSNMTGCCPFHSEKTPSFTVFTADNSFYCFGCGVGGNAITFVRKIENLDFTEAVTLLTKRAGITVRTDDDRRPGPRYDRKRYFEMNRAAAKFFHRALYADTADAKAALSYFTDVRHMSEATIKHFGLGFAPNDFSFLDHMRGLGYTEQELINGFLCGKSEKGRLYPSFRNRVMFPIIDLSGEVVAFGGRVMDDGMPKYKNSSDTPVFHKSNHLFALNFAHKACGECIILCEGYMDVIAMHAAGFTNAVATLGTAIRPEQARLMARYTKKVIISYDSDAAGQKAADRALRLLEGVGLEVRVLKLPDAKDPDEYIRKFGAEKFRRVLEGSKTKFEFNFEKVTTRFDINDPQQKIEALNALCDVIAEVYTPVEREVYISEAAKRLSVTAESIAAVVEQRRKMGVREARKQQAKDARQSINGFGDTINPDFVRVPRVARAEEAVLGLLQLYPEYRKAVFATPP